MRVSGGGNTCMGNIIQGNSVVETGNGVVIGNVDQGGQSDFVVLSGDRGREGRDRSVRGQSIVGRSLLTGGVLAIG